MKNILSLIVGLFSLTSQAQVILNGVVSAGNGCAQNTAEVVLAPDNSAFTILYPGMQTEASGPRKEQRRQCNVEINFTIPVGKMLEFSAIEYRGFMSLDGSGAWGYVNNRAYFLDGYVIPPGRSRQISNDKTSPILRFFQQGPLADEFYWRADFNGQTQRIISPCNGVAKVRVKTEIISSNGPEGGTSLVNLDSADGTFSQLYKVMLKPCEKK